MTKIGGYKPNKEKLLKKAIRELGAKKGLTKNTYYRLTNQDILEYMNENRLGVLWITIRTIRKMRMNLPKIYREVD